LLKEFVLVTITSGLRKSQITVLLLGLLRLKQNFANNNNVPKNVFHNISQSSTMYYYYHPLARDTNVIFTQIKKVEEERPKQTTMTNFCMSNNSSSLLNLRFGTRKLSHFCVFVIFPSHMMKFISRVSCLYLDLYRKLKCIVELGWMIRKLKLNTLKLIWIDLLLYIR
jgi:hypothetical protein